MKKHILLNLLIVIQVGFAQNVTIQTEIPENVNAIQIINNYLNSIGGIQKIEQIHSIRKEGVIDFGGPTNIDMKVSVIFKKPNLYSSELELTTIGTIQSTKYDGKKCVFTRKNNNEFISKEITGKNLEKKLTEFHPFPIYQLTKDNETFIVKEIHSINDHDITLYKIGITTNENIFFYFDKKNSFLVKKEEKLYGSNQKKKILEYKNYEKVDNLFFPFSIIETIEDTMNNRSQTTTTTITLIKTNEYFGEELFK